jgi:hypothetical protein
VSDNKVLCLCAALVFCCAIFGAVQGCKTVYSPESIRAESDANIKRAQFIADHSLQGRNNAP